MWKRTVAFFSIIMVLMCIMVVSLFMVSEGSGLAEAAARQQSYKLTLSKSRGTIYDCNMVALTNKGEKEYVAAVAPTIEAANVLSNILPQGQMSAIMPIITEGKPFTVKLPANSVSTEGVDIFTIQKRYTDDQQAAHVIGYLDGSLKGVSGIEKSYNDWLSQNSGTISVTYKVDAVNRVLSGDEKEIVDTTYQKTQGVVLTLDTRIQQIAEDAAKPLKKGAVIVAEVPTCKIRALASVPDFSPNDVADVLNDADSPLVNRAFSAYNFGSVFKLVTAAAALDAGISPDTTFDCTGSIEVDGSTFHCFNGAGHGHEDMLKAIAYSCNSYFVNLSKSITPRQMLTMSKNLGFGKSFEFAPGLTSNPGHLPTEDGLMHPTVMANISFGQGELLVTPVQVVGLINAIASNGKYTQPSLVEGLVNSSLQYTQKTQVPESAQVMKESTAKLLQQFMAASIEYGTSSKGKPTNLGACAKTATAETGIMAGGHSVVQAWFAGYYPQESPKYVIVVLGEDGEGGGATCGPVFKQVTDNLYNLFYK